MKKGAKFLSSLLLSTCFFKGISQVNLQTGAAQYSIPLYSYSDPGNRIGAGISLVYTAGNGLKVSEIPSSIGAGWTLDGGGFIQRIQHGEPDDQRSTGVNSQTYPFLFDQTNQTEVTTFENWVKDYYPDGYLYATYSDVSQFTPAASYTPLFNTPTMLYKPSPLIQADREQDAFVFNFNGRTGTFIIGRKDQDGKNQIRTLYDSKLSITKVDGDLNNSNNIRTTISEFQIIDENGIKYIFKDAELNQICDYDKKESYNADGTLNTNVMSHWYYTTANPPVNPYTSVTRANTKNSFVKNKWYLTEIVNPLTNVKIEFQYEDYNIDIETDKVATYSLANSRPEIMLTIGRLKGTNKRLKKIIASTKESVEFNYSSDFRQDIPSDKALDNIIIKYDDVEQYRWLFDHGYFVKNEIKSPTLNFSTEDKVWARLCLTKIRKSSPSISEPSYSFSYFLNDDLGRSAVPPLFSYYQDAWGYYNPWRFGGFYNPSNQTTSTSNPRYEPFGGNILPKSILEKPVDNISHGVNYKSPGFDISGMLQAVTNPMGGTLTYSYEPNYISFTSSGYLGSGGVRVSKITEYDGINQSNDKITEYKYVKDDEITTSGWGDENYTFQKTVTLRIHKKCADNSKFPGIDFSSFAKSLTRDINHGLTFMDAAASNFASQIGTNLVFQVLTSVLIDLFTATWSEYSATEQCSKIYSCNNMLPFQYSRVEEIKKLGTGTIGKTVYEFTSPDEPDPDFDIDIPQLSSPFSSRQRCASWLYGLPKSITQFNKDNQPVHKIEKHYEPIKYSTTDNKMKSLAWEVHKRVFGCDFDGTLETAQQSNINYDEYYPIFGRVEMDWSKEYVYNNSQESAYTTKNFEYSADNFKIKKVVTFNSKGEQIEIKTYYPSDYTLTGTIQTMQSNNMVNVPISTQTLITKSGTQYLLSGGVSEYGITSNGDIKLIKTYVTRLTDPITSSSAPFSGSQLLPSSTFYFETGNISYTTNGLPSDIIAENGKSSSLYDYNNKLAIATIVNAVSTDVAYTSFEADGSGNWTKNGTLITTEGITGSKSFNGSVSKTLSTSSKYILTAWNKGSGPITANSVNGSLIYTIGDWKLYQWELTNISSVQLAGDFMDEVRLYPENSRMSTVTYNPIFGKIAECDEANHIVYYEYDGLGRIKFVRDENRNIIKMYEYNFKN